VQSRGRFVARVEATRAEILDRLGPYVRIDGTLVSVYGKPTGKTATVVTYL